MKTEESNELDLEPVEDSTSGREAMEQLATALTGATTPLGVNTAVTRGASTRRGATSSETVQKPLIQY